MVGQIFNQICMKKNGLHIDKCGVKCWYRNDLLHRLNEPAEEWPDGTKRWFINNLLHRKDGPAEEWADGSKLWYQNGKRHREDGPAVEWSSGATGWYLNGSCLGYDAVGFWSLWNRLTLEQQNNLNIHQWLAKYT